MIPAGRRLGGRKHRQSRHQPAAYAFTQSASTAVAVGNELQAGGIGVNSFAVAQIEAPFGGIKDSGYGNEGGDRGEDVDREPVRRGEVHRGELDPALPLPTIYSTPACNCLWTVIRGFIGAFDGDSHRGGDVGVECHSNGHLSP
jgi:Aldehyde dehydrogenase family